MIVQKFGGSSVKSVARIKNVANIVARAPTLNEMGERAVSRTGAQLGIITESVHNTARIVDIRTDRIRRYLDEGFVVIAAGFQGTTAEGDTTTLGRGGSDTTAVAIAAALGANVCDIFTDVSGVYTADPNLVPGARLLKEISYEEMLEMARVGAQVLHPRAVELARKHRLPLRVRNTFDIEHEGTILRGAGDMEIYRPVSGVTVDRDQARLAILEVPDRPGIAGEIFGALAKRRVSVDMIIQAFHQDGSVNDITFTIKRGDLNTARELLQEIASGIGARGIIADPDVAKVSIVGAGLMDRAEIASEMFSALGRAGVNIKMISTSEIRISCAVSDKDAERAVTIIHELFKLGEADAPAAP